MSLPKNVNTTEEMPWIPLSRLRRVVNKLENLPDHEHITLEFVLLSFFPTVWKNIEKYATDCYTNGYIQGLKDGQNNEN